MQACLLKNLQTPLIRRPGKVFSTVLWKFVYLWRNCRRSLTSSYVKDRRETQEESSGYFFRFQTLKTLQNLLKSRLEIKSNQIQWDGSMEEILTTTIFYLNVLSFFPQFIHRVKDICKVIFSYFYNILLGGLRGIGKYGILQFYLLFFLYNLQHTWSRHSRYSIF